jgi:hypothetical protein
VATLVEGAVDLMLGEGKATASDAALDQLRREVEKTLLEKASPELKALVNTVKRQSLDNHTRSMMAVLKETAKGIKTAAKAADAYTKTMPGNLFNTEPKEIRQQFGKLAPHIFIAGHIGKVHSAVRRNNLIHLPKYRLMLIGWAAVYVIKIPRRAPWW